MKIERTKPDFSPISIHIQTAEELDMWIIWLINVGPTYWDESQKVLRQLRDLRNS